MVDVQLASNGADAPFFDMVIAQDLSLKLGRDGHDLILGEVGRRLAPACRRRNAWRTKGEQRHPHQWQCQDRW
jgi:hypothetical protein